MNLFDKNFYEENIRNLNLHAHISLKNNFVYFCASKCASGTIKAYLYSKELEGSHFNGIFVDDKTRSPFISPYQLGSELFIKIINDQKIRKICFVRNPFFRVLGCYLYRIHLFPNSPTAKSLESALDIKLKKNLSFKDFLNIILKINPKKMEGHFRPLNLLLYANYINYDFIGRVENLGEDLRKLAELLYKNNTINKFGKDVSEYIHYSKNNIFQYPEDGKLIDDELGLKNLKNEEIVKIFYDEETIEIVKYIYKEDFILFGYQNFLN